MGEAVARSVAVTAPAAQMTVPEAREHYSPARPDEWHSQPVCTCGEFIAQHGSNPPHPCLVCRHRPGRKCRRYEFARVGTGDQR